jgi:hypothetical protein
MKVSHLRVPSQKSVQDNVKSLICTNGTTVESAGLSVVSHCH